MGLFRRRGERFFSTTGHDGDDQLLSTLAGMGDLSHPRHWVHYVYFPGESSARDAGALIERAGWRLQRVDESAAGGPEWVVIAEREGAVTTPDAVREARLFFESIAQQFPGSEYDGWEASL